MNDRRYFELSTFYAEFTKDWQDRRLPMRHEPHADALDVYRARQEHNGGSRYVPGAPRSDG